MGRESTRQRASRTYDISRRLAISWQRAMMQTVTAEAQNSLAAGGEGAEIQEWRHGGRCTRAAGQHRAKDEDITHNHVAGIETNR